MQLLAICWKPFADQLCPHVQYERHILKLNDGGEISLDWVHRDNAKHTVIIVPGMSGHSNDKYCHALIEEFGEYEAVVINPRGITVPLRTPKTYTYGNDQDIEQAITHIVSQVRATRPKAKFIGVGVSLGGSTLINYLGKACEKDCCPIEAACVVSVPYDLLLLSKHLETRKAFFYNLYLLKERLGHTKEFFPMLESVPGVDTSKVVSSRNLRDFDKHIILPLEKKYISTDDYFRKESCVNSLLKINIPLLGIHSRDDMIVNIEQVPFEEFNYMKNAMLVVAQHGAHAAFLTGTKPYFWFPKAFRQFITSVVNE